MARFAFYVSGRATRLRLFYETYAQKVYSPHLVVYDGGDEHIFLTLRELFKYSEVLSFKRTIDINRNQERKRFGDFLLAALQRNSIDYTFCFGSQILSRSVVDAYPKRIINFHPSLLPKYPGLNSIDKALSSSEKILGNTAHFIDNGVDTGEIILQSWLPIEDFVNYDSVLNLQIDMLKELWLNFENYG